MFNGLGFTHKTTAGGVKNKRWDHLVFLLLLFIVFAAFPRGTLGASNPLNQCHMNKLKAMSEYSKSVFTCWSKYAKAADDLASCTSQAEGMLSSS